MSVLRRASTAGPQHSYGRVPDGQRLLMLKPVEYQTSAPTQINSALNWLEELKRVVPSK